MPDVARYYWKVETQKEEIYVSADSVEVTASGCLVFWRGGDTEEKQFQILALASGTWLHFYAASVIDGGPVRYIEHWDKKATPLKRKKAD